MSELTELFHQADAYVFKLEQQVKSLKIDLERLRILLTILDYNHAPGLDGSSPLYGYDQIHEALQIVERRIVESGLAI